MDCCVLVFYNLGNFLFSEMFWRGRHAGEHFCCRLRLHPDCRQVGWAEIILRQGNPIEAGLRPARLKRSLEVVPDESPITAFGLESVMLPPRRPRLQGRVRLGIARASQRFGTGRMSPVRCFRRLETRLFHYGLVPLGSEGT